jgi:hypothetical protein
MRWFNRFLILSNISRYQDFCNRSRITLGFKRFKGGKATPLECAFAGLIRLIKTGLANSFATIWCDPFVRNRPSGRGMGGKERFAVL